MVTYKISKSSIQGNIVVPPSKSQTMRAILFGTLGTGRTQISNYLPSPDAQAMIHAGRLLGAKIQVKPQNSLEIEGLNGQISTVEDVIQAGNSGIVLRFVAAIAALSPHYTVITGDHSIRHNRPIKTLLDALTQLGAFAISTRGDGYAPIVIRGPLIHQEAVLDGRDSQPVSALLIAAALRNKPTTIIVTDPGEKPWVFLTLDWFNRLGISYSNDSYERFELSGNSKIRGFDYTVPADLSSAAFPIAAAVITNSELTLQNINMNDAQGDKAFVFFLQTMGARIEIDEVNNTLTVKPGGSLEGMEIDINSFIDALPIMAVVSCFAKGETRIVNAGIAREKESDRLHAIATELQKMGADIQELPDGLIIRESKLKGNALYSHNDHRIAMALAVAALGATGETAIDAAECVSKTFPDFASIFHSLGAQIEVVE